MKMDHHL